MTPPPLEDSAAKAQLDSLHAEIRELRNAIKKLTEVEINYQNCRDVIARYGTRLDRMERVVHELELFKVSADGENRALNARIDVAMTTIEAVNRKVEDHTKLVYGIMAFLSMAGIGLAAWIATHPQFFVNMTQGAS